MRTSGSKSLKEVGDRLGVSKERVRQLEHRALRKLSRPTTKKKIGAFRGY